MGNFDSLKFLSFLLIKNIDFSELDAKVEAGDASYPVRCFKSIKLKDRSQIEMLDYCLHFAPLLLCFCVICRKDYRAIEVEVFLYYETLNLYLLNFI